MEKFTASNGRGVSRNVDGYLAIDQANQMGDYAFSAAQEVALREFFRHERDEELGRWRSSIHPSWTAVEDGRVYRFTNDDGKRGFDVHKEDRSYKGWLGELREVAKEFLGAHPASNPWHDAKPGEVWVLTVDGETYCWGVGDGPDLGRFIYAGGTSNIPLGHPSITKGRRIWPEVSDA